MDNNEKRMILLQNEFNKYQTLSRRVAGIFPNEVIDYSSKFMTSKLRMKFGKEFFLSGMHEMNDSNKLMHKFLTQNIKNFDRNYLDHNDQVVSFIWAGKIDTATFMYVATNIYMPNKISNLLMGEDNSNMYMYIFGRKSRKYIKQIEKILEKTKEQLRSKKLLVMNSVTVDSTDISVLGFENRDADSLIYSHNEIQRITDHIDRFNANVDFYKSRQLNYKTGILLYGNPGTGKSTIVKILASKYNRNIIQINISKISKIDFAELTLMINNDIYENYIILLEELDTVYLKRAAKAEENKSEDEKSTDDRVHEKLDDLLQFLDSNSSPNNVIFIATTNHVDKLDPAIIRDGRFDLRVDVKEIKKEQIKEFCEKFDVDYEKNIDKILEMYGTPDPGNLYNQSKLQNILIQLK